MPSVDLMLAFALATFVFGYMPGPGMLYATAQTIAGGWRAGFWAAVGLHVGGYVHVIAAAFGLAALFQAVPVLYVVLKGAGALYLIWLGVRLVMGAGQVEQANVADMPSQADPKVPAFWQSVTVEVLNPKTAIFYLAFLPQFTDVSASLPLWAQLLVLGTIVNVVFSSADLVCVVAADRITRLLARSKAAGVVARRMGGSVLIGLGISVAFLREG